MLYQSFLRPCAQCSAEIIAPAWSECLSAGCVRNVWSCDGCGYEFEDTVYFSAPELQFDLKQIASDFCDAEKKRSSEIKNIKASNAAYYKALSSA
jgi:hypothetical protein